MKHSHKELKFLSIKRGKDQGVLYRDLKYSFRCEQVNDKKRENETSFIRKCYMQFDM